MKKRIASVMFCLCICILAACAKKTTNQPTTVSNVSIAITNASPSGATVKITDTNQEPYTYGEWYCIEEEKNGQWMELEPIIENYGFTCIGYLPDENQTVEFETNWEWLYGKLSAGKYRLLKQTGEDLIAVEFEIK